jgi:hypothetical protein
MVNVGVKRVAHLAGGAGKLDDRAACRDLDSLESVLRQPACNRLNIRICRPKLRAELLRSEPIMIIGRILDLLLPQ